LATKVVPELDDFTSKYHFFIGLIFLFFIFFLFLIYINLNFNDSTKFNALFKYAEGIEIGSSVKIAGIKIGEVTSIELKDGSVYLSGLIDSAHPIPSDSILQIQSDGIFGNKYLLIEPGFDFPFENNKEILFTNTSDSYSIDMFLRYLSKINE
jgi:phospholipid/cholesterol/gamma-HCH transport system substrate-binding protein